MQPLCLLQFCPDVLQSSVMEESVLVLSPQYTLSSTDMFHLYEWSGNPPDEHMQTVVYLLVINQ